MYYAPLVALLILFQYLFFTMACGMLRAKTGVAAPACTGDETFERAYRVQQNTLEQLMLILPGMFLCAVFFRGDVAAICGLVFFVGRFIYRASYMKDPQKRTAGMIIGMFATVTLLGTATWGVLSKLI